MESALAYPHGQSIELRAAFALRYAILAPSSHNSQPWLFHVAGDDVEIYADRSRGLHVVDPSDRELIISCGAALHHLRTAFAAVGQAVDVSRCVADDRLARVRLLERIEPNARARRRLQAVLDRRTIRTALDDAPAHDEIARELVLAAREEHCTLTLAETAERHRLADLVATADRVQASSPEFRRELASWIHPNRARREDGMPASTLGVGDLASVAAPFLLRHLDWGKSRAERDRELAEASPFLAVLGSLGDSPRDWLAAGEALSAVLLDAASYGLAASFLNQPVEVPPLRAELRALFPRAHVPQLVLRLGIPVAEPAESARTLRRSLEDVLV
jgi:hypothetical protein